MLQQRFLELKTQDNTYTSNKEIESQLSNSDFYWILECEVDSVKLEIKDNILYWISGIFYWGNWKWGIWKNGDFLSGVWNGGIFYNGTFKGTWIKGVEKGGTIKKINNKYINEHKSNLNENFYNWFGDSKVVTEDGKPLICYHGTNATFNEFKVSKYGSNGQGVYLTPYKDIAKMYSGKIMEVYVKIENNTDGIIAGYEVIVKKPENIKSINNNGDWNINSKNIYE